MLEKINDIAMVKERGTILSCSNYHHLMRDIKDGEVLVVLCSRRNRPDFAIIIKNYFDYSGFEGFNYFTKIFYAYPLRKLVSK